MTNEYVLATNDDGDLAVRTVSATEASDITDTLSVITRTEDGKLAVRTVGGGGDAHNKGYFATLAELQAAYPTGEAGDWAIVAESDTVYIWDDTQQAWVDTDQKGQVTSVNNKTGAVVLGAQDVSAVPQYSTMPQASEDELGNIYQFTGTTDANYTNGYFYKCVSDGQNPATYSWTRVDVQPAPVIPDPLPSQTGQSGKFLTTDGTDASWATVNALQNTATGTNGLTILGTASNSINAINIGASSVVLTNNGVALGRESFVNGAFSLALGTGAKVGRTTLAKGQTIQLGEGENITEGSLQVKTYTLMSADGTVPTARLADTTNAQQGDVLTLDSSGNAVWQAGGGGGGTSSISVTLPAADWVNDEQTVTATGVTASNTVIVGATPASASEYNTSGVICTAQGADSLTFSCSTTPSNDLTVTVLIF